MNEVDFVARGAKRYEDIGVLVINLAELGRITAEQKSILLTAVLVARRILTDCPWFYADVVGLVTRDLDQARKDIAS